MSRLDYGCQLWSPYLTKYINMVERVQRSFTRFISGMAGLSYTERLTVLKLYSLQRRRERYIIIYVWKILEGLVPNLYPPICTQTSDRRGRTCISSHINVGQLGTLEYNSFRWSAIHLFNQLPLFVRNTTICSINSFKKQLDSYSRYSSVSDMLDVLGWTPLSQRRQPDRRLDLFCFTKLLTVWHKCTSKASLSSLEAYKGTRRKHNMKFRQIGHITSQSFFPKTISAWNTFATFACLAASNWLPGHPRSDHHVSNPHRPDYY